MPLKKNEWNSRIKTVELDYRIARFALDRLIENAHAIANDFKYRDILRVSRTLEANYAILLFAEFETGLRSYWDTIRDSHPKTEDLLTGLAARRKIPDRLLADAHRVREYRNRLVHERDGVEQVIGINVVREYLCTFFYRLPPDW